MVTVYNAPRAQLCGQKSNNLQSDEIKIRLDKILLLSRSVFPRVTF